MKVKLITDSASDITPEDEKKYGIDIMPFDITLGDESLRERVDFTAPEFLEMIDKSEFLPKTSQITEIRFAEKFEHYYNEGYDAVIMVLINSTGSKTYENALLARKNLLEEHPEMAEEVKKTLYEKLGLNGKKAEEPEAEQETPKKTAAKAKND